MKFWPEVHWSEGQFLRPHHLQAAFRQQETLRSVSIDAVHPYGWGFYGLDLASDSIANAMLEIRSCEARLKSGTMVRVPENCDFTPREFKDQLAESSGAMDVYFGVPEVQTVRANVQLPGETLDGRHPRYVVDMVERYDENTGDNPQSIEVRRMKGAVFFGTEDHSGFECVRLGSIERSAAGPSLVKNVVPPVLQMRAWPALCMAVDVLWNDIRSRAEQLGADAAQRALTFSTGSPGDIEQLMKLAALNELTIRFGVLAHAPELHPYQLYQTLGDGIGRLAIWDDMRRPREIPAYDHDDCGPIFEELIKYVRALVQAMLPKDFVEREFTQREGGFGVDLDYEWFTPNHEMYLGIRSRQQLEQIQALFQGINFKLASPKDAETVYQRRLPGLEFKPAGAVANLPKSGDLHYFRIARTPPYWANCERERGIFIRMPPVEMPKLQQIRMSLFVIKIRG
ncbi:hypothetical protein RAS1_22620 [Phycisphaerae bacterium RAS1]|nr:hypothetical protein RAS1_22620 [Phycisphaerae bacterium RAS1]